MSNANLDELLQKIHSDGVLKAEKEADRIISTAEQRAKDIINTAEQKAKKISLFQERESAKAILVLQEAAQQTVRDLGIKLESEILIKFKHILNCKVEAILKGDDTQILKWILDSNAYEVSKGVKIESSSCGQEEFKSYIMSEFKENIESIKFLLSDHIGFRIGLEGTNAILDYTSCSITDQLIEFLGDDFKQILNKPEDN